MSYFRSDWYLPAQYARAIEEFLRSEGDDPVTARLDEIAADIDPGEARGGGPPARRRWPVGLVARGEVWWLDFGVPVGSAPRYRRPGVVVSSDRFNRSRLATVIVAAITSNLRLANAPGNVVLPDDLLPKPSVVNVTQLLALDRDLLDRRITALPVLELRQLEQGLRLVLGL